MATMTMPTIASVLVLRLADWFDIRINATHKNSRNYKVKYHALSILSHESIRLT